MAGFVERITEPSVVVRVGPRATAKPALYEATVFGAEIARDRIELKGYDQRVKPRIFTEVMVTLWEAGYRFVQFERLTKRDRTVYLELGPKGAERMLVEYHDQRAA